MNKAVMEGCCPEALTVEARRVEAAEADERWSVVQRNAHQRWLWYAIEHLTGVALAYMFGSRADEVFVELQKLRKPFGLVHFYTGAVGSMTAISSLLFIPSEKPTPNGLSANIWHCGHGPNAELGKHFVSRNRSLCLTR